MSCKHAIIITAGYGTRRLPVTKAVEKCMMPILDRPMVDYIVEDCINAGVEHIIFVIGEGSDQIKKYFSRDEVLERYLREHGKDKYLECITPPDVTFDYVEQTNELLFNRYGTNTAVALARPFIPDGESALVLMGDAILYTNSDVNPIKEFIREAGAESAVMAKEIPLEDVASYGVLALDDKGYLDHMVEKPAVQDAPSNLINLAEYIFTSRLLDEAVAFDGEDYPKGKERYVNLEPFDRYMAAGNGIKVISISGEYLDIGSTEKWLQANIRVAKDQGLL